LKYAPVICSVQVWITKWNISDKHTGGTIVKYFLYIMIYEDEKLRILSYSGQVDCPKRFKLLFKRRQYNKELRTVFIGR
jgi:hypothetical protein